MALPRELYKQYCRDYFRAMFDAGWSVASHLVQVYGCERMCESILLSPESDEAIAYANYCAYRNRNKLPMPDSITDAQPQSNVVADVPQLPTVHEQVVSPSHVPDQYTNKDGLYADERLLASQNHTIIMLLTEIAENSRAIRETLTKSSTIVNQ